MSFTEQFIEYIQDNTNKHVELVGPNEEIVYGRVTVDYVEEKEDWWKLAEVLNITKLKKFNYIQEMNLFKYDDVYQIEYSMKNTDTEWKL